VEICVNEQYGTVCDMGFDRAEARVICGQLGYSRTSESIKHLALHTPYHMLHT
jgi:hypothetical protein